MTIGNYDILMLRPVWLIALLAIVLLAMVARRTLVRQPAWQRMVSLVLRAMVVVLIIMGLSGIVLKSFSGRAGPAGLHERDARGTQSDARGTQPDGGGDQSDAATRPPGVTISRRDPVPSRPNTRALLIATDPASTGPLREALSSGKIVIDAREPASLPAELDELVPFDVVLLSNVPAAALSDEQVAALDRYVAEFGGGLILIGGDRTLTAGGYEGTRLEEILPVATYLKKTKKKPRLAMLLVLDRSGSMEGESIALAKQAARIAVERLAPGDQVGVIAFEDRPHWITPLVEVTDDKQALLEQIDTIRAAGGTNMGPALDQAILALRDAYADLRHIILMTDGVSHPADFDALARQAAEQGITISTVGVGPEAARPLLADIAETTGGHAYFADDAAQLPQIFELETVTAGRAGITEEPFRPATPAEVPLKLEGVDLATMPTLLGYVDTRPKPYATVALSTPAGDPLLAWWRWGQGLSVAFTSDVRDRWAAAWLRWDQFGPFWRGLVELAARDGLTQNFTVRLTAAPQGTMHLDVDALDLDGRWINGLDVTYQGPTGDVTLPQTGPGRYSAELPPGKVDSSIVEFTVRRQGRVIETVRQRVAAPSQPAQQPEPAGLDRDAALDVVPDRRLWPWLLLAAIVLLAVDVFVQRHEMKRREVNA